MLRVIWGGGVIILVLGVASALLPGSPVRAPGVQPPQPGVSGRLLYTYDGGLWVMDLGTGATTQIVAPPDLGQITAARWSPDGTRIAYARFELRDRRFAVSEIFTASPDGSSPTRVLAAEAPNTLYQSPAWDASGTHVYFSHAASPAGQRVRQTGRVRLDGGPPQTILEDIGPYDVSRDGKLLAIVRSGSGGSSLVLFELESGAELVLVPERQFDTISSPRFEPSDRGVAFAGARAGGLRFGGGPSETQPSGQAVGPAPFTGDLELGRLGALLAARPAAAHGPTQDLYTVPVAGGAYQALRAIEADEPTIAWSPDGAHLAILSINSLSTMSVAGGNPVPIRTPGGLGTVDWAR